MAEVLPAKPATLSRGSVGSTARRMSRFAPSFIDYGAINFTMHNTTQLAEFVLVRSDTSKKTIVSHMRESWELTDPGVLLRVTGAVEMGQVSSIQGVLEGIVTGVSDASGCIFSNGLDFGLAAVVGTTINSERHRCQAPLIGVPSWTAVQGREQLVSKEEVDLGGAYEKGLKKKYADAQPDSKMETVSLQPVHTHFVIVKGDEKALKEAEKLSAEEKLMAARVRSFKFAHELEEELANSSPDSGHTPRVLMVLNGDRTTLREVVAYAEQGRGIICLAVATGGLAEALADFIKFDRVPDAWSDCTEQFRMLKRINRERAAPGTQATPSRITDDKADDWPLFLLTDEVSKRGISDAIMDAAMRQASDTAMRVRAPRRTPAAHHLPPPPRHAPSRARLSRCRVVCACASSPTASIACAPPPTRACDDR